MRTRRSHAPLMLDEPEGAAPVFADFDAVAEPSACGTRVPHRDFVMVSEDVHRQFHRRWRAIEREWRGGLTVEQAAVPGMFDAIAIGVGAARDELRAWARSVAAQAPGEDLVPV